MQVNDPITAQELWRLFMWLGGGLIGVNALMMGIIQLLGVRKGSREDDQEEGARRLQLSNLLEMAKRNETRWEEHREWADGRLEEFRQTQATVGRVADAQERLVKDVEHALAASAAAGEAVTKLATGLAVSVRFGEGPTTKGRIEQ